MAARKGDGEKIKADLIDEKTLTAIMKRFLGTKAADPDVTKYYRIEDGVNFMATTFGSAVQILFSNKHIGTFTKGTGKNFFRKPLTKGEYEDVEFIPEMETVKEGKKSIKKPTGRILEYPDVSAMFNKFDLNQFLEIEIPFDDLDDFIAVHEAMENAAKIGGTYNTAELSLTHNEMKISLYDSPLEFNWSYFINKTLHMDYSFEPYHYDFALMTSIIKSIKDLKVSEVRMYIKDTDHPILFVGSTVEYNYNFAINRKLVLVNSDNGTGS